MIAGHSIAESPKRLAHADVVVEFFLFFKCQLTLPVPGRQPIHPPPVRFAEP